MPAGACVCACVCVCVCVCLCLLFKNFRLKTKGQLLLKAHETQTVPYDLANTTQHHPHAQHTHIKSKQCRAPASRQARFQSRVTSYHRSHRATAIPRRRRRKNNVLKKKKKKRNVSTLIPHRLRYGYGFSMYVVIAKRKQQKGRFFFLPLGP